MQQISSVGKQPSDQSQGQPERGSGAQSPVGSMGGGFVSAGSDSESKVGGGIGAGGPITVKLSQTERDSIIKLNKFSSAADVAKKLGDIKSERKNLRTHLD